MPRKYDKLNIEIPDDITDPLERKRYYQREHYRLQKESYKKSNKKWVERNKEKLDEYKKEWYEKNKGNKKVNEIKVKKEEFMCLAKDFIEEIESQNGWCDTVQAFRLTHLYSEIFGAVWNRKYNDMEDELSYMYLRLKKTVEKGTITFANDGELLIGTKECRRCGIEKPVEEFGRDRKSKDGKRTMCKICATEYQREYFAKNPDKHQKYKEKWKTDYRKKYERKRK